MQIPWKTLRLKRLGPNLSKCLQLCWASLTVIPEDI